jgi:ubiquitin carboxyl-terminal hydrolase 7
MTHLLISVSHRDRSYIVADNTEQRLEQERELMEARRREKDEQHLYLTAKIITDDSFARHSGFDLASFDDKNLPATDLATFRVLKQETYATFKQRIAAFHKIDPNSFRLWVLVNRQNKTIRPDVPISEDNANQSKSARVPSGGELTISHG